MIGSIVGRAVVLAGCLLVGAGAISRASLSEETPPRQSFSTFPADINEWKGQPADRFDQRVLDVLGVDEYVNRVYFAPGQRPAGLYIGFYQSQRYTATMHSPMNCLPGSGWQPVKTSRMALDVASTPNGPGRRIMVNLVSIQKGLDKQVVVYWYQSHGRVVASEYWGKIYTVLDAIRLNRTDAAMVRIISPVGNQDRPMAEEDATRSALGFARAVFPLLSRYLPD
jgi:EpsI family protein